MPLRRIIWTCVFLIIVALSGAYISYTHFLDTFWRQPVTTLSSSVEVTIPKGMSSNRIIRTLREANILSGSTDVMLFHLYARRFQHTVRYQAGDYFFPVSVTPEIVSLAMVKGHIIKRSLTIPEGWLVDDITALLKAHPLLSGDITKMPKEGYLLPETYQFIRAQSRQSVIDIMQRAMQRTLAKEWEARQDGLPLSNPDEALILASIIEKETGEASERSQVAGVFINRLNKGMKLQSDPTANYGIYRETGTLNKRLFRKDIQHTSPYNTYHIAGLPPSPICNPGRASIHAALNPAPTDALYFVADGKGGHVFAKTLSEHNRNVAAYHRTLK